MTKKDLGKFLEDLGYKKVEEDNKQNSLYFYTKEYQIRKDSSSKITMEYHIYRFKLLVDYIFEGRRITKYKAKIKDLYLENDTLQGLKDNN